MKSIGENEIHIWFVYDEQITDPELLSRYQKLLSDEEVEQQKRFYFTKHSHQYLITRALVRTVLSHYVNNQIRPEEWRFKTNKYGKPLIANPGYEYCLSFNLSHTNEIIALAITYDSAIGIDVEWLLGGNISTELASRYFSPLEVDQLITLPIELQKDRFLDLWTLKEAYIKACGMGLSIPLDHFSYQFLSANEITISFAPERNDQSSHWCFWQIHPNPTHKVAVAIKCYSDKKPFLLSMLDYIPMQSKTTVNFPIFRQSPEKKKG